ILEPKLAVLDETDSGLDIDALRVVADGVNKLRRPDNATILVTHYQRLLNHIVPDYVHVLAARRIVKSGGKELALELEERGYDWITDGAGAAAWPPFHSSRNCSRPPRPWVASPAGSPTAGASRARGLRPTASRRSATRSGAT